MTTTTRDPRGAHRDALRARVVAEAWRLAERDGLDGWTLRDLAAAVGMRAPSLYTHFDGKDAIHDAMFADGWRRFDDTLDALGLDDLPPREALVRGVEAMVDFCTASVPRYRLLFTHALGAWQPTPDAYAASEAVLRRLVDHLARLGVHDPTHVDLFTALTAGLVAQQLANDGGGQRWRRLVPDAVEMFLAHATQAHATQAQATPAHAHAAPEHGSTT